nr:hypothetical protein [Tanacetum cinerariifolium]
MDETPKGMKLRYDVVHLEQDAFQWDEYVRSILDRFSKAMFEDPLEEFASLNQTEMEDDDDEETEEIGAETEEKEHHISIHALTAKKVEELLVKHSKGGYLHLFNIQLANGNMVQNYQPMVSFNSEQVQLDQPWYELTQTYSEVFQTPKGLPPTRPFDPGEMDQSGSYESFGTPEGSIRTGRYMGILG